MLTIIGIDGYKKFKSFEKELLAYLTSIWQLNRNPSLQEVVTELKILDNGSKKMLIKTLRKLRVEKKVDGYYDPLGIYKICSFKHKSMI